MYVGCVSGSVDLVGGVLSDNEGAVRMCVHGNYVPVSAEGLSIREASFLCRQAGKGQGIGIYNYKHYHNLII